MLTLATLEVVCQKTREKWGRTKANLETFEDCRDITHTGKKSKVLKAVLISQQALL